MKQSDSAASQRLNLLSEIGIEILSLLSVEQINEAVYTNINKLMDADVFGIGVYNPATKELEFPAIIEKGKKMPAHLPVTDKSKPASWCFLNKEVLVINDLKKDFNKYFSSPPPVKAATGDVTQSLVYYPLTFKEKILGVITVQSFNGNAYSDRDIDILKNLSIYIATAIHNAKIHESTEELVKTRSAELVEQKEELERAYKNTHLLSEVGQKISSSLSVQAIIDDTYSSVRNLMDAQIFGIAVVNPDSFSQLDFHVIEYEKRHPVFSLDLGDNTRPGTVCFNTQELVFYNDFENDIKKISPNYKKPLIGKQVGSLVYLPLTQKERKIGVITVQNYEKNIFTEQHIDILKTLAVYVSSAIENALLYANMESEVKKRTGELVKQKNEIEKAYEHIKIVDDIGKEITSTLDFEVIFEKLNESVSRMMKADVFGIRLYRPETNTVDVKYEVLHGKRDDGFSFSMENKNNYSVWSIENKKEVFLNDQENEYKKYVQKIVSLSGKLSGSLIFCPMILGEKVLGVVTVQTYEKHQYTNQHLNIIKTLANYAAIALENAEKFDRVTQLNHQIEESFKNIKVLSEIGQEITSTLNFDDLLIQVYDHVNKLMDATEFGVGIFDAEKTQLDLCFYMFKGERMQNLNESRYVSMEEEGRLSVWCIKNKKEVFINDMEAEISNYIPDTGAYKTTDDDAFVLNSLICLPLIIESKVIGLISIQSEKKNAYSLLQLEMFRTLASYTAVALNNADSFLRLGKSTARLEESYKNIKILGEIGQKITSTLKHESILDVVYNHVEQLMDATEFGVGLYDSEINIIDLSYYIYKGKRVNTENTDMHADMSDDGRLSVWCVKNKTEVFINDIENEYHKYIPNLDSYKSGSGFILNSLMCLPLVIENNTIGIISVQSPHKNAYSQLHLEMFRTLASYTTVALNNADAYLKLNESTLQLDESFRNIKVMSEIGQKITATLDFDKVLHTVYENVNLLMDAYLFIVFSVDEKNGTLTYQFVIENEKEINKKGVTFSIEKKETFAAWCARHQKEILIGDIVEERSNYVEGPRITVGKEDPNSLIYIPLIVEKRVIGVMSVQSLRKHSYTEQNVEILRTLAAYAAIALDNALVYKQLDSALHEVEKLSVVASKTNNTVIICNPDTEIEWANEAFERNFGYSLEEFKEKRGKTLLEISGRKEIESLIEECKITKHSVSYESVNVAKDGSKIWFHTTLTPVYDESGTLRNIVAIDSDITSLKKVEEELTQKNKDITDSINYARKIQNSILPSKEKIKNLLPDSFVLYKPRDIVSGDFYWVEGVENNSKIVLAAIDCTGHGVPGAFITIVGNSLLNQIVNERGINDPRQIIMQMNKGLIKRLSFSQMDGVRDGMDMSVCLIEKQGDKTVLTYAGAFSPMYYFQNGELKESVPARISIGSITDTEAEKIFNETITVNKGDMVYLFTDGFADQLGEATGKKFLKGRFKNLLNKTFKKEMKEQKSMLEKQLKEWKGNLYQTDDVLVIGVRV